MYENRGSTAIERLNVGSVGSRTRLKGKRRVREGGWEGGWSELGGVGYSSFDSES